MNIRYTHTLLFRLMALFIVILLPIALIGSAFISRSIQLQDDLVASTMLQRLGGAVATLQDQMASLQSSLLYLLQERELTLLSSLPDSMSDFDRAISIASIQRKLYTLHMNDPNLYMLSLCVPQIGLQLNSLSYGNDATIQKITQEDAQSFFERGRAAGAGFSFANGLCFYYQVPALPAYRKDTPPRLMVRADYNLNSLLNLLGQPLSNAPVALVITDRDREPLAWVNASDDCIQQLAALQNTDETVRFQTFLGQTWYTQQFYLSQPDVTLTFAVSREEALGPALQMRLWLYAVFGLVALSICVYTFYAYSQVQLPVNLLMNGFARLEAGDMDFQLTYRRRNEFGRLITRFNRTLRQLQEAIAQLYDQKILTQQAEMKHLQAQINPHFLYNSFYLLNSMLLMEDYDAAGALSRHLGAYFKYVTHTGRLYVRLNEELDQARVYLSIQQMRFQDGLKVHFPPLPAGLDRPAIPRLTLQPLLENAFKHAFDRIDGPKEIWITYDQDDTYVYVTVQNSGPVLGPQELAHIQDALSFSKEQSTGLGNVHKRLVISHGTGLRIQARAEGGLSICVPLKRTLTEKDLPAGDL